MNVDEGQQPGATAWSRLWRSGVLHSCSTAIKGNYDGQLREFWYRAFSALSDEAVVVDLGTGNGAIPLLAKQYAAPRQIHLGLHGVDIADIDPCRTSGLPPEDFAGITFHPRTSITTLPFPDRSVDLVTSQFAFEYAPRAAAVAEVARIVAPRGTVAMVLHSDDSVVSRVAQQQASAWDLLYGADGFIQRTRAMLGVLESAGSREERQRLTDNPRAESARQAFNASASVVLETLSRLPAAVMLEKAAYHAHLSIRDASQGVGGALARFDQAMDALYDEHQRLVDLRAAVLDRVAIDALADAFRATGFRDVTVSVLDQAEGARMGWTLVANRG